MRRRCTHQIDVTWQHRDVFLESSVEESVHFKPDALVASQHSCSCCLLTAVCGRDQGIMAKPTGTVSSSTISFSTQHPPGPENVVLNSILLKSGIIIY